MDEPNQVEALENSAGATTITDTSPMGPIRENAAQVVEVLDPCMQRSEPPAQPGLVSVEGGDDALLYRGYRIISTKKSPK